MSGGGETRHAATSGGRGSRRGELERFDGSSRSFDVCPRRRSRRRQGVEENFRAGDVTPSLFFSMSVPESRTHTLHIYCSLRTTRQLRI